MISVESFVELLKENNLWVGSQSIKPDTQISGKPVTDSRQIQVGDVFICIKGAESDGHNYIKQAQANGIKLIVQENAFTDDYPAVRVKNSRKAAALLAKLYFDNPSGKFVLIGVTGTNGKTTTSLLIWQALTELGFKTGWIGTLGYRIDAEIIETNNTTPDILELNGIFQQMVDASCQYVVMEVSSHAMALDRVYGTTFKLAIFTNLSRDHLDFHPDMNSYFECKYQLFKATLETGGTCIINHDDDYGKIILKRSANNYSRNLIAISEHAGDVTILKQASSLSGSEIEVKYNEQTLNLQTQLIGRYNAVNLVMAVTAIKTLLPDISNSTFQTICTKLKPVRGRLEQIDNAQGRGIFVDYAHTPDALSNVLTALQQIPHKRLLVVFGAGGDRDSGKRKSMLNEVLKYSDVTIITDDNPRFEDPNKIIRDIVADTDLWKPWWIIRDRETAIHSILRLSQPGDIVLIAGKGHEAYQEIKGIRYPFDDAQIAKSFYEYGTEFPEGELYLPVNLLLLELLCGTSFVEAEAINDLQTGGFKHISTDSRTIKQGSIYFALKGENFDGHDYVERVLEDPTCCSVVSKYTDNRNRQICCSDTENVLGLLAAKYLLMFSAYRIALTGSTGKTTTKEYMANVFSTIGKVLKTHANENNRIGLSKTIFRIAPADVTAIFELGTNHFGEIGKLADICNPDLGIITNIGPSHLEFFIDEKGIYNEKTTLFRRDIDKIMYHGDDARFAEFETKGCGVGFTQNCDYRVADLHIKDNETIFNLKGYCWQVPQIVPFYVSNIAFAVACALECGVSAEDIQTGLQKPLDLTMRMEIKQAGSKTIIMDCYNANPVSMQAAIEFWSAFQPDSPHIAILGDMLELGAGSAEYHKSIGCQLSKMDYQALFTVGELSQYYFDGRANSSSTTHKHLSDVDELVKQPIIQELPTIAIVLVKASHGVHLEKLIELFDTDCDTSILKNGISEIRL